MHFTAYRACQKCVLAAIFAVADNRVANRCHVHAQLVRPARIGLQLNPSRGVARAFDDAVACPCGLPLFFIHMHFFAATARLFADGQVDETIGNIRYADNQCPIDLTRGAGRKCLGKMPCRPRRARQQQCARRVLVQPVDKLWPVIQFKAQSVQQTINMIFRLGPALRCQTRWLIDHQRSVILVDHHAQREFHLVVRQLAANACRPRA